MFQISKDWSDYDLAIIKNQFGAMDFDITAFVRNAVALIPRHGKILDLGCGAGRHSFILTRWVLNCMPLIWIAEKFGKTAPV